MTLAAPPLSWGSATGPALRSRRSDWPGRRDSLTARHKSREAGSALCMVLCQLSLLPASEVRGQRGFSRRVRSHYLAWPAVT
jgi:hypothetical protein